MCRLFRIRYLNTTHPKCLPFTHSIYTLTKMFLICLSSCPTFVLSNQFLIRSKLDNRTWANVIKQSPCQKLLITIQTKKMKKYRKHNSIQEQPITGSDLTHKSTSFSTSQQNQQNQHNHNKHNNHNKERIQIQIKNNSIGACKSK